MLALIPARGGSKGLPGKNIRPLLEKPLIQYSIEAALQAQSISRVVVSTDSEEIASVAKAAGAEVPFLRPAHLAQDDSLSIDVYLHACEQVEKTTGQPVEHFAVLLPTTPLRLSTDIDECIKIFFEKEADSVISLAQSNHTVEYSMKLDQKQGIRFKFNIDKSGLRNRQSFEPTYFPNGAVYVFRCSLIKMNRSYYSDKTYGYIMPPERSVDIDTLLDFKLAELLIREAKSTAQNR